MKEASGMGSLLLRATAMVNRMLPDPVRLSAYRFPALAGLIRRVLNRAAPEGLTEITVAAGALRGARLLLDLKSEKYYWLGNYEPMLEKAIADFVKPGMVVYDVGAHIGYTTLLFARAVGASGKVFAFEPLPANIERLRVSIALNDEGNIAQLISMAVSDQGGHVRFLVHSSAAMGKLSGVHGRNVPYMAELDVPAVCLDDFVYQDLSPPPNLIKMDIEGGVRRRFLAWIGSCAKLGRPACWSCMGQRRDMWPGYSYRDTGRLYTEWLMVTRKARTRAVSHGKSTSWGYLNSKCPVSWLWGGGFWMRGLAY